MKEITCAMCGHTFDPSQHRGCAACPLHSGCQLTCCPHCGYEVVDPNQSFLARTFAGLFGISSRNKSSMPRRNTNIEDRPDLSSDRVPIQDSQRLTELSAGAKARILGFSADISNDRKAQLQAYGVVPGNYLRIRQHRPVTVVQIDHTELAFESDLANAIFMERL